MCYSFLLQKLKLSRTLNIIAVILSIELPSYIDYWHTHTHNKKNSRSQLVYFYLIGFLCTRKYLSVFVLSASHIKIDILGMPPRRYINLSDGAQET